MNRWHHDERSSHLTTNARSLRKHATMPERFLWARLRGQQFGEFKFRRQFVIGEFIVDFAVPQLDLVIEIDGHSHDNTAQRDLVREKEIEQLGWRIIRFSNDEVLTKIHSVLEAIEKRYGGSDGEARENGGYVDWQETLTLTLSL